MEQERYIKLLKFIHLCIELGYQDMPKKAIRHELYKMGALKKDDAGKDQN
jgi:hypothetical protein